LALVADMCSSEIGPARRALIPKMLELAPIGHGVVTIFVVG
jgi:hypothetical protein